MKNELLRKKFRGKKILITGNTGFVGSWLSILLYSLGAKILGYSLKKKDKRFLSNTPDFKSKIKTIYSDINNFDKNFNKVKKFKPQIVIHLASQPIVLESYVNTKKTYFTNVMGTVNFFENIKKIKTVNKIIVFTSDKVYMNLDGKLLNENSNLGGIDPYSASKSCQDIISSSYKSCFLKKKIDLTIIRAGNIIGGGDWNLYRLVPDIFKSPSTLPHISALQDSILPFKSPWEPTTKLSVLTVMSALPSTWTSSASVISPLNFTPLPITTFAEPFEGLKTSKSSFFDSGGDSLLLLNITII